MATSAPTTPLHRCPHMLYRCPHRVPECFDPSSKACVHVINTIGTAASVVRGGGKAAIELPIELRAALEAAEQVLFEVRKLKTDRSEPEE